VKIPRLTGVLVSALSTALLSVALPAGAAEADQGASLTDAQLIDACSRGLADSCEFTPSGRTDYLSKPHVVGDVAENCTPSTASMTINWADQVVTTSSFQLTVSVGFSWNLFTVGVQTIYHTTWSRTQTFSDSVTAYAQPYSRLWLTVADPKSRIVGDYHVWFDPYHANIIGGRQVWGDYYVRQVVVDGPNPDAAAIAAVTGLASHAVVVPHSRPMSDSQLVAACGTDLMPPAAPHAPTAAAGNASANVTVSPPSASSGGPATSYVVTAHPGGRACAVQAMAGTCTVKGLHNNTAYTFTAVAHNPAGHSSASSASKPVTPRWTSTATTDPSAGARSAEVATSTH
jgi:hypothetical protein